MLIITITMIILFLLGMLAFGSSILLCILGLIVSVGLLLLKFNLLPLKNLTSKSLTIIKSGAIVLMFIIGAFTSMSSVDGGINAYEDSLEKTITLIQKDKLDEAWEEINVLKETYGASNNTVMLEVLAYIAEGSYDSAIGALNGHSNKTSVDYYSWLETVYLSSGSDNSDNLSRLYTEAAAYHPYWTYVQKMAGIALISRNELTKAEYHLLRAYEQEPSDYKTAYYLGVTCYEQRRMDESLIFFQESVDRDPDDETLSYIAWYIQEIGE